MTRRKSECGFLFGSINQRNDLLVAKNPLYGKTQRVTRLSQFPIERNVVKTVTRFGTIHGRTRWFPVLIRILMPCSMVRAWLPHPLWPIRNRHQLGFSVSWTCPSPNQVAEFARSLYPYSPLRIDAAFGFYQRDPVNGAGDEVDRNTAVPGSDLVGGQDDQAEAQAHAQPSEKMQPPQRSFDPLAKKTRKKGKKKREDHGSACDASTSVSGRLNALHVNPTESSDALNPRNGLDKTLQALGIPSAHQDVGLERNPEDSEGSEDEESSALVDMIMRQLLSKDVLYEPMREIGAKYPGYLESHREGLSTEEVARYESQQQYIQKICAVYESGEDRYDELMELLQGMQACGNPPEAIMEELSGDVGLGGLFGGDVGPNDEASAAANGCPIS